MNFIEICKDLMSNSKYHASRVEELKRALMVESSEGFKELVKALNAGVEEGIFYMDENQRYDLAEKMGVFKGVLKKNPKGFGFVENEELSYFVAPDKMNHAFHMDEVLARMWVNADGSEECEIVKIIAHQMKQIIGTIKIREGKKYFLPDTNLIEQRFDLTNMDEFPLVNDMKVMVEIDRYGKVLKAHISKVIGYKYDPGIDILSVLLEHDVQVEFPQEVMDELKAIPDHVVEEDFIGREDLRDQLIITIDGATARDLDDAISVERLENGYRLGVHIADVSHYVKAGSAIDRCAYERATSIYVTDRVVPMLPQYLSNGICSLNPQVDRCTLSCVMDISMNGKIENYRIFPSVIKTRHRMTYDDVNLILDGEEAMCEKYADIVEMMEDAFSLSQLIRYVREEKGSIDFDTKEGKVILNQKGKPIDVIVENRGIAEGIIEDFMIQANEVVAAHMKWMHYPSIYRVHENPDLKKMRDFNKTAVALGHKIKGNLASIKPKQCQRFLTSLKGSDQYSVLSTCLLRCMAKARYDRKCLGHFGLALQEYTHFTSPIRRYPDLIVHRMLRKYFFEQETSSEMMRSDEAWIEKAALNASEQERKAIMVEREVDDMKKAEFMEDRIGEVYEGVISGVTKFGMFVELDNTVEGLVHVSNMSDDHYHYDETLKALIGERTGQVYRMGERVKVQVLDASRFKKQIDFKLKKKREDRSFNRSRRGEREERRFKKGRRR